jgi:HPt (histidine-containing phosphotransfer) domain-containing protein
MVPETGASESSPPVFDRSVLGDRLMDDGDLIAEIIAIFLEDVPRRIASLKEHLISERTAEAGEQAHSIKGAAADVGGEIVRAVAFEMEKAGKAGDLEALKKTMPVLEKEFERLKEAMKA